MTTIGNIETGETFNIGNDVYEKTAIGLIKNAAELLTASVEPETFNVTDANNDWTAVKAIEPATQIDLTAVDSDITLITADKQPIVAVVGYEDGAYNLTAGTGIAVDSETTIILAGDTDTRFDN